MNDLLEKYIEISSPKLLERIEVKRFGKKIIGKLNNIYQTQYYIDEGSSLAEIKSNFDEEFRGEDSLSIRLNDKSQGLINYFSQNDYKIAAQETWFETNDKLSGLISHDNSESNTVSVNYSNYDIFRDTLEKFFKDTESFEFYAAVLQQGLLNNEEGESLTIYMSSEKPEAVMGFLYSTKLKLGQVLFAYDTVEDQSTNQGHYRNLFNKMYSDARQVGLDSIFTIAAGDLRDWGFLSKFGFKISGLYIDLVRV
jgi:hypothetical protein